MTINAGPPLSYHAFRHGHMTGAGIVTPVAGDDDGTDEANRILNLVLWSSSLAVLNTGSVPATTRNKALSPLVKRKTRRPKKTTIFPTARTVRQGFPSLPVQQQQDFSVNPRRTMWYHIYVMHPQVENPRFQALFRRRFRLPNASFLTLNSELEVCPQFSRWHTGKRDMIGFLLSSPISILILSALRYLGRSWTLDDLQEATCISEEVIRVFLHQFLDYGSTVLYERWVTSPDTYGEARTHVKEYEIAGFPGAVGSTDATHVLLERVSNRNRQAHLGFKSSHTARAYNITVNHRRQILSTTSGHPARWNDKTLQLFDPFMEQLHQGKILDDLVFHLYSLDAAGTVVKKKYQDGWLLVDNSYLSRSTTVPPIKTSYSRSEIRFSAWLESLRKDVECTFGILKGRWRILKSGIHLHGTSMPDKVFHTCCALHNLLLNVDGLHTEWNNGVPSDYATTMLVDDDEVAGDDIPTALKRLANPVAARENGIAAIQDENEDATARSSIAHPEAEVLYPPSAGIASEMTTDTDDVNDAGHRAIKVRDLSLDDFRRRLVVHFEIAFRQNEVEWPRRLGRCKALHLIQML
jgi:hypothetical protein